MSKQYDYRDENGNFLDYFYLVNELTEYGNEIERLNNIIDELEIELLTNIAIYSDDVQRAYEIIYDKLKELKQEN